MTTTSSSSSSFVLPTATTTTTRTEKVFVLYGSQTGNSEQAAKDICDQMGQQLSPLMLQKITDTTETIILKPIHISMDDFLELEYAAWTRLIVIVVSSYGVGQAPLGAYRFRELCDAWTTKNFVENQNTIHNKNNNNNNKTNTTNNTNQGILQGVYFAMCGLGDSKYTTFFENPTKINDALLLVGAERVGPLGKADASSGKQLEIIEEWINNIWPYLANVVVKEPLSTTQLEQMQQTTFQLCQQINPDLQMPQSSKTNVMVISLSMTIALLVVLLSIAYYFYSKQ